MNLLAAERIKLFSTRSFWWCSALTVLLVVGPAGLFAALSPDGEGKVDGTEFVMMGAVVVLVMATLTVTTEYRHRTIRTLFQAVPNRAAALLAKTGVVALAAGSLGLIAAFGGRAVAWLLQPGAGVATSGQWRVVAGAAVVFAATAVLAVAVGILVRHTAGAVSLLLVWVLVAESVVAAIPHVGEDLRRWLPFENAEFFLHASEPQPGRRLFADKMLFGPWVSLAYFVGVAAALLAVALVVVSRRDA